MADTDQLIRQLAAHAIPVRPLRSPFQRTLRWTGVVVAMVALLVAVMGTRSDLGPAMSVPATRIEWIGSVLTGLLAGYAVFQVSVPGGSPRWGWLPVPALLLWLGGIGMGCLGDWARLGAGAFAFGSHGAKCLLMIIMTSLPLVLAMMLAVRHAAAVRPLATAVVAALSTAGFAAAGVSLVHAGEAAVMVLLWHFGAVLLLVLAAAAVGPRVFAWIGYAKSG